MFQQEERNDNNRMTLVMDTLKQLKKKVLLVIGNIFIYLFGLAWLTRYVGEDQVFQMVLYPFLLGDALKLAAGLALAWGSSSLI